MEVGLNNNSAPQAESHDGQDDPRTLVNSRFFSGEGHNPAADIFDYEAGIRLAASEGRILGLSFTAQGGSKDHWTHFSRLQQSVMLDPKSNARPLDPDVLPVLGSLASIPSPRFLELGPGAGLAASALSRRYPNSRIDTVSNTPINPYLRFRVDRIDASTYVQSGPELARIFEPIERPFISLQQIGTFPTEVTLPPLCYNLIYETMGPIAHHRYTDPGVCFSTLAQTVIAALAEEGVLFVGMQCESDCRAFGEELSKLDPKGRACPVTRRQSLDYLIFARAKSPFFNRL